MTDIAIEFRVKNGRLKRAILAKWPSYIAFCRANHVHYQSLSDLLCMRVRAVRLNGEWREAAMDIATALHFEPEELWPDEMRHAVLSRNGGEFELSLEQAASLTTSAINRQAIASLVKGLRPNELRTITAIARGQTLVEAGKGAGTLAKDIRPERTRQIAMRAVRKMCRNAYVAGIQFSDVVGPA